MLPTPMKAMKPATGANMPAGPVTPKPMKKRGGLAGAAKGALAGAASTMGQGNPLGGARLLPPPRQAGSVRANAARGMAEQQSRAAQMQAAQEGAGAMGGPPGLEGGPPPGLADRMQPPGMENAALGGMNQAGQMQQMAMKQRLMQQMQKQKMMQAMQMQQQQGRGLPQNMGDIQSLIPPGMEQGQMEGALQGMENPNAGRFMGAMGPYAGAGMMGGGMRNFNGFDPRFGGG